MATLLLFKPKVQFFDDDGNPLSGGKVYFFEPGTSTPKDTYADKDQVATNTNPVILDSRGEAEIWIHGLYKVNVTTSGDVQVDGYPVDDVSTEGATAAGASSAEWLDTGDAPTFISTTQFSTTGDQTATFQVGRRIKLEVTAGTVYGVVTASAFTSLTTVTVSLDTGNLDSGISDVAVGLISVTNTSLPPKQIQSGELLYIADSGAADAYVGTFAPALTAYATGQTLGMKITNANLTTTPTVNFNALGAKTIKRVDGSALTVGDLPANHQAVFRYDGTDMILLNPFYPNDHDHSAGKGGALASGSFPDGALIQKVQVELATVLTGTTAIPYDNSKPQITEGFLVLTRAITPISDTNELFIEAVIYAAVAAAGGQVNSAIFQDSTADAIVAAGSNGSSTNAMLPTVIRKKIVAGTTDEIVFTLRVGHSVIDTVTINGENGVRKFGGACITSITITEIQAS